MLRRIVHVFLYFYLVSASVIRNDVFGRTDNPSPVDCSILQSCGENMECMRVLTTVYRFDDCFERDEKRSLGGGDKRGGLKNLKKIFLGSYISRMGK